MAVIREGGKTVVLVVDVQVGVMRHNWESPRVIANINKVVSKARSNNVPVIWVQHADDELVYGSPDWQIVPELTPAEGETRIYKGYNSAFADTPLDELLEELGAAHIVLTGAATNWCIRATAYGALERGYDLTLVKDAHTTGSMEYPDGFKIDAEAIVRELNSGMTWLSYPGRVNKVLPADEVAFS